MKKTTRIESPVDAVSGSPASRRDFLKAAVLSSAAAALPRHALAAGATPPPYAPGQAAAHGAAAAAELFARAPGQYPGAPDEDFRPTLMLDPAAPYRNLALNRPAFASSSYDYNLTAQLVTDGLVDATLPRWISTVVNGEVLPRNEREIVVDHFQSAVLELPGADPSVELHLGGGAAQPVVDRMELFVVVPQAINPAELSFTISVSDDGHTWRETGRAAGGTPLPGANYPPDLVRGSHLLNPSVSFDQPFSGRFYRASFRLTRAAAGSPAAGTANSGTTEAAMASSVGSLSWRLGQMAFFHGADRVQIGGPYSFTSAWKSAGSDQEWVSVDLGAAFPLDRVRLHWISPAAEGKVQLSDDNRQWRDVASLGVAANAPASPGTAMPPQELALPASSRARYVRVWMSRPASPGGYILSELEVFGHGGFVVQPHPAAPVGTAGRTALSGGGWRLQRAGYNGLAVTGEQLSQPGFADAAWPVATVPGTVLTSYLNVDAIPDPNVGDNQLHLSDSFFHADFWYRTEFPSPRAPSGHLTRLVLEGINWKADVFLNGKRLGEVDGAFERGMFNVTAALRPSGNNALAILVRKPATPGSCKQKTLANSGKNGGALGADNPAYHASIGWDWIPTIRGRNTGIWAEVALVTTGESTLADALVSTVLPLPGTGSADVSVECVATHHGTAAFTGILRGTLGEAPRQVHFEQAVRLAPGEHKVISFTAATHPQLHLEKPELWWPTGYGEPKLHPVELVLESRGSVSDRLAFEAGLRQMSTREHDGVIDLFINGRRVISKGGSWGFPESMLRFRAREYDAAVRYHRDMNFNMIRNWVGQTGDDAFFAACDRHGILIWQDFWLANPWDGPVPEDNAMFLANARDYLSRIRHHPSIAIYCGRNEWYPPKALDTGLRALLAELHPGMPYIGSSADGPVSGHGPYRALTPPEYFRRADIKIHSEIGAPAIPPLRTVEAMIPPEARWPLSLDYGLHDFTMQGAQGGESFGTLLNERFGGATNLQDWVSLGEIISYEAYRAMFESQSVHRMGVLLWMSHPCWPSFVWQTYDYYLQPTASYFGSRLGCEPLHIQWNSLAETVEVFNSCAGPAPGLHVMAEIFNLDGTRKSLQETDLDSADDSTSTAFAMRYPAGLDAVHLLRLTLSDKNGRRSRNFYLRGREEGDLRAIRTLPRATVSATTTTERRGERWLLTTRLRNTSAIPALYLRLEAQRSVSGDRIAPALYSDGFFLLLPGEESVVTVDLAHRDTRGEVPRIALGGFNLA